MLIQQFDRVILGTIKPFIFLHTHKTNVCYSSLSISYRQFCRVNVKIVFPQKLLDMLRDSATVMVGQYFKKKRCLVEMLLLGSSGLGVSLSSPILLPIIRYGLLRDH